MDMNPPTSTLCTWHNHSNRVYGTQHAGLKYQCIKTL